MRRRCASSPQDNSRSRVWPERSRSIERWRARIRLSLNNNHLMPADFWNAELDASGVELELQWRPVGGQVNASGPAIYPDGDRHVEQGNHVLDQIERTGSS